MTDDGLEAFVAFGVLRLPEFDSAVCTSRDQNFKAIDRCEYKFADFALVSLGRFKFDPLVLLSRLNQVPVFHVLFLVVEDLS